VLCLPFEMVMALAYSGPTADYKTNPHAGICHVPRMSGLWAGTADMLCHDVPSASGRLEFEATT
jgi:hypothetical protein